MNETRFLKYSFPRVSLNLDEVNPQAPALVSPGLHSCHWVSAVHNQSSLWVIMDTDATQSLSMERQGFTKQKGAGSKRSSICWGREPTGWCCTRLDSALAVNLKGHTGGSNRRNTECGSWHSFLNLNNSKKRKNVGAGTIFLKLNY